MTAPDEQEIRPSATASAEPIGADSAGGSTYPVAPDEGAPLPGPVLASLRSTLGERLLEHPVDLVAFSYDGTFLARRPAAVALPVSTAEVSAIVSIADRAGVRVVTRGAGTSLTGGTVPAAPGELVLDLARMDRILAIDREDMTATVEAGVVTADLHRAVEAEGLFYPPDPASLAVSTIGGNLACNAGGPRGLKYGVTRDYALALEVVLADGRVTWTGSRTMKNATGYALTQLFVGSEGTLGIITRAVLRLIARPAAERTVLVTFDHLDAAAALVGRVLAIGVVPATIELVDRVCLDAVEAYRPLGLPGETEAVLLFRLDGSEASVRSDLEMLEELAKLAGVRELRVAARADEADVLWQARRAVSPALARLRPNKLGEDIVVPRGAVVELVRQIGQISERWGLPIAVFGHIGDGNLHPNILFDAADPAEVQRMLGASADLFAAALTLGGTLSGEHGIGILKKDFLPLAVDPVALTLMRELKTVFDPRGTLNPGKVLPDGESPIQPPDSPLVQRSPFGGVA